MLVESLIDAGGTTHKGSRTAAFSGAFFGHMIVISLLILVPILTNTKLPDLPHSIFIIKEIPKISTPTPPAEGLNHPNHNHRVAQAPRPSSSAFIAPREEPSKIVEEPFTFDDSTGDNIGVNGGSKDSTGVGQAQDMTQLPATVEPPSPPPVIRIEQPQLLHKVDPIYPIAARLAGIQGTVDIDATTDVQGRVIDVQVVNSSNAILNNAAVVAVQQWIYRPFYLNGKPRPVIFHVTVTFKLR